MASPWVSTKIYLISEQVTFGGSTWTSTQNYNYNNTPVLGSVWWSGGGGGGGGVTGVAIDSVYPGTLRLATSAGGPPVLPGALTAGNVYVGATGAVGVDTAYGGALRASATNGGPPAAAGTLLPAAFLGVPFGASFDIAGSDFALPAVPAAGTSASNQVTAVNSSIIEPGQCFLIPWAINIVNADTPGGTPHNVYFDTGTDMMEVQISGACLLLSDSITENLVCAFINRPGATPQTFDSYGGVLVAQTDPTLPASDIDIKVSIFNRSGAMSYGSFSTFGAQVCPLVLKQST